MVDKHEVTYLPSGKTVRVPEGTTLANGQAVVVFGTPAGPDRLAASRVRVINRSSDAGDAQLGGSVSELGAGSFRLNDVSVAFAGAIVTPASRSLADGAYVQVRGTYGSDRVFTARHIKIRNNADEAEVQLNGTLFDVDAIARTASVRGTRVDTAGARLRGCPGGLVEGGYVEMAGSLSATAVQAADIQCRSDPAGAVLERRGTAAGVDTALSRFTLATGGGALVAVHWSSATRFVDISVPTLSGRFVHVLGSFSGGVLEAQEVIAVP